MIRRRPITRKPTEAASCRALGGITLESEPPAPAPSRLANTRARALPAKTAPLRLEVPLIVTMASWVLSPSSARKTVAKVETSRGNSKVGSAAELLWELDGLDGRWG